MKLVGINNPQHPLWATVRFLALVLAVSLVLKNNAQTFDETEIKAILEIALIAGGYEGIMAWKKGTMSNDDNPT